MTAVCSRRTFFAHIPSVSVARGSVCSSACPACRRRRPPLPRRRLVMCIAHVL